MIEADLRDADGVQSAVSGVDVIFHEAAFVSVPASMEDPRGLLRSQLRWHGRTAGGGACSRCAASGSGKQRGCLWRFRPTALVESATPKPLSPYAASKLVDEIYAALYTQALGLEVCALRYFNVFGPRQRPDTQYAAAVPIFIRQLLAGQAPTIFGDGGQTRDLIFVGDVVRANLLAAEHPAAPGQVLNVCTGIKTRVLDLVEELYELLPGAPQARLRTSSAG